jgi:hypothetical protein
MTVWSSVSQTALNSAITAHVANTLWVHPDPPPLPPPPPQPAYLLLRETTARTWTNQGAGPTEFVTPVRTKQDLASFTEVRLCFEVTTLGVLASLRVDYSTNGTQWVSTGVQVPIGAVGLKASAWASIPGQAKADVWLRIVAVGGNATEDPVTRNHEVQVR